MYDINRTAYLLFFTIIAITIVSCKTTRSIGIEEGWELLGEQKVNFVRDKDVIDVDSRYQFTAIRFRVEDKDVIIKDLVVIFQNGDKLTPAIEEAIPAGGSSREIELARDGRYIDRIEFTYRSTGSLLEGRSNVLVLGKRYYPGY